MHTEVYHYKLIQQRGLSTINQEREASAFLREKEK